MKKFLYLALLINLLLVPFQYLKAESFADADDLFKVVSPLPNSKVGGNINIEWNSFDDDQTSIPYYIQLLDGATCKTTSYGRVNPNSASTSSTTTNNKINWDTHKTESTQSLSDGNYCLQICSAFKNGDAFYSICNGRNITIVNVNKLPTITSTPTNLIVNENEPWQYQVKATDADNDALKYYLVFAPDFLEINASTGVVKTKDNVSRIANDLNIAEYRVVVGVEDGVSGTTTQEFTIKVERGRVANPTGNPTNSNDTPTPQNTPAQISFNSPKENAEFAGVQNFIDWSVYDPDGVKEATLSYSKDLENWTEIVSKAEDTFSRYSWDVTSIEDGKYYLQLKIKDKKDEVVAKTSKQFTIKNTPDNQAADKPLIINIKPENSKILTDSPTSITGEFAAATGQIINNQTFKLTLNDTDLTKDCVTSSTGFECSIKNKLAAGDYKIKTEIQDSNGNTGSFESNFTVELKLVSSPVTSGSSINSNVILIVAALVLLIIVLVGIPWFFIGYSKRKSKSTIKKQVTVNLDEPVNYAYPQAAVTYQANNSVTPPPVQNKPQDQSGNFSDFMSSYNFNSPQNIQSQMSNPQPEQKKIGEVKLQKTVAPKTSISDSFKNLTKKVSEFIPKSPEVPNVKKESIPVQLNTNPNLSENIQGAYSQGTSSNKAPQDSFVEPQVIDDITQNAAVNTAVEPQITGNEYITPTTVDNDEDLRRMYPELYGTGMLQQETTQPANNTQTDSTYYEPTPKD